VWSGRVATAACARPSTPRRPCHRP
jgi:hypothetical protein